VTRIHYSCAVGPAPEYTKTFGVILTDDAGTQITIKVRDEKARERLANRLTSAICKYEEV
jgi:hypothetical protein